VRRHPAGSAIKLKGVVVVSREGRLTLKATGVTDVEVGLNFYKYLSYVFLFIVRVLSSSIRRLTPPNSYFVGLVGPMVAKGVASVSDRVVLMKEEGSTKNLFPYIQHVISMKDED